MDCEIARKINGDAKSRPAPYSTSETAAHRLLRRLAREGLESTVEQSEGSFYCTIRRQTEGGSQRVATGSGETRPLAVARAVLNATLDPGAPVRSNNAHPVLAREIARIGADAPTCRTCGIDLPLRTRTRAVRYCGVCSWNRIKDRLRTPIAAKRAPETEY